jgi:hypothetical protein
MACSLLLSLENGTYFAKASILLASDLEKMLYISSTGPNNDDGASFSAFAC